jgi:Acyl-CoA synthetases (AMP-forming)/AMP-acid ligases II
VLVVIDNFGHTVAEVIADTPVKQVITTALGDMLDFPKRPIVNFVLKYVKKMVPDYHLPGAVRFGTALKLGSRHGLPQVEVDHEDVAFLQYTGGTTGVSKGAILTHRNLMRTCSRPRPGSRDPA